VDVLLKEKVHGQESRRSRPIGRESLDAPANRELGTLCVCQ